MKPIDPEWAKKTFEYTPETGALVYKAVPEFRWKDFSYNLRFAGKNALYIHTETCGQQRLVVHHNKTRYVAARICWAIFYGKDPGNNLIDHRNGDTLDNRIENLRLADFHGNAQNRKRARNNRTGYTGVAKGIRGGYLFHVQAPNKKRHWGYGFLTARHAAIARDEVAKEVHGAFFRSSVAEFDARAHSPVKTLQMPPSS